MNQKSRFLYLSIAFIFIAQLSSSQTMKHYSPSGQAHFLGLGFGINDYGIGIGAEVNIQDNLWVYGMGGISTWGL